MDATRFRLNRLFAPRSGRCLTIAADHGFYGRPTLLTGVEDMGSVIDRLVELAPDALLLTPGQAPLLQRHTGRNRPALLLRVDITNVHGAAADDDLFADLVADPVGQALRLDAAGVVVNLYDAHGREQVRRDSVANVARLKAAAEPVGMPVFVEPFVYAVDPASGEWTVIDDAEANTVLMRQAVELGADVIKADPTDRPQDYGDVLTATGVPVLVRGGGRIDESQLFRRTAAVLEQGASGLVYGRNVIQHPRPAGIVAALQALVHDRATAEDAEFLLQGD